MKLRTFIAVAAIGLLTACSSTYRATDTGMVISTDAQRAFDEQYPYSTNVVWTSYDPNVVVLNDWELAGWDVVDADDYTVRFDLEGEKYYAWYDRNGNWIGSAYVVRDFNTLPVVMRDNITKLYPGYAITSVNKEFHKDKTVYEVVLKNTENKMVVLIDADGNVVRSKTKALDD